MTMSSVPTNPRHGVSWHLVWGLLDPVELHMWERNIHIALVYILVLDIFKLIMVTIYFVFSQHTCFIQITMNCVKKMSTYINIIRWDYSPTNPNPYVPTNPNDILCNFMLLLQKAETTMTNHFSLHFVAQQGSVTYQETSNHNHLSAVIKLNIFDCLKIY